LGKFFLIFGICVVSNCFYVKWDFINMIYEILLYKICIKCDHTVYCVILVLHLPQSHDIWS
jgi:hypothetical protein